MDDLSAGKGLPLDACEWVPPATLRSWVEQELNNLSGSIVGTGAHRGMLGVLGFAYARGIFDTAEILGLCRSDALFRSLCGAEDFSWDDMLVARHRDRGLLVTLTVRLLTRLVVERLGTSAASLDPALKRRLHESAVDRLDSARNMDRGEE